MKWFWGWFVRRGGDFDEEIRSHLEMAAQDGISQGEPLERAYARARREFGNIPLIREVDAELSGRVWLDRISGDVRYVLRQVHKSPGYAITAILTLAIAIGANTALFSIVHAVLIRQLPFNQPSRVFTIEGPDKVGLNSSLGSKSPSASFNDAARELRTIESIAVYSTSGVNMDPSAGTAQRLRATETSARFLDVLGVSPSLGRGFARQEEIPGNDHVVLISDRLWRGTMNADPGILGRAIKINGFKFDVIGVLPPGLDFPAGSDLWTPTIFDEHTALREAGAFFKTVLGRAKERMTIDVIRAELKERGAAEKGSKRRCCMDRAKVELSLFLASLCSNV